MLVVQTVDLYLALTACCEEVGEGVHNEGMVEIGLELCLAFAGFAAKYVLCLGGTIVVTARFLDEC